MIYIGNSIEILAKLKENSIQCIVTSPPYFGLRDYSNKNQIGLEDSPEEYIQKLVFVFRECRRVLKDDGTLWVNIGDSYAANRSYQVPSSKGGPKHSAGQGFNDSSMRVPAGMKPKDIIGIPWMLAFALRSDGWYLRQDIIWEKPNAMPESVKDRCTKAHEMIFLLSKNGKYYFNNEAIQEDAVGSSKGSSNSFKRSQSKRNIAHPGQNMGTHREDRADVAYDGEKRNRRSVWKIPTKPYRGSHCAVFPVELPALCILAGSRPDDAVLDPFCGAGTTGIACRELQRSFIGIELNPEYAAQASQRSGFQIYEEEFVLEEENPS